MDPPKKSSNVSDSGTSASDNETLDSENVPLTSHNRHARDAAIVDNDNTSYCSGDGSCFTQDSEHMDDYRKIPDMICEHQCQLIQCPNYELCNSRLPKRLADCHNGLCLDCNMNYGTWKGCKGIMKFKDDECCVCYNHKRCISLPKCTHFLCIDCFNRIYNPHAIEILKPPFPYGKEMYEEYLDDPNSERWNDDFIIMAYEAMTDIYNGLEDRYLSTESKKSKCPLCRK